MDLLEKIIDRINDPTVLVLLVVCAGLFLERRENGKRIAEALDKLATVITDMRVELAKRSGK